MNLLGWVLFVIFVAGCTKYINMGDDEGRTVQMHGCIMHDGVETQIALFDNGVDCSILDNNGYSALDYCVSYNRTNSSRLMMAYGCKINRLSEDLPIVRELVHEVPYSIFEAIRMRNIDYVKYLIDEVGVPVDARDVNGCPLIAYAILYDYQEILRLLIMRNCDIRIKFPKKCSELIKLS
jgi:ankyrin repeat protein